MSSQVRWSSTVFLFLYHLEKYTQGLKGTGFKGKVRREDRQRQGKTEEKADQLYTAANTSAARGPTLQQKPFSPFITIRLYLGTWWERNQTKHQGCDHTGDGCYTCDLFVPSLYSPASRSTPTKHSYKLHHQKNTEESIQDTNEKEAEELPK